MSFFWGVMTGSFVGIYYAEKRLTFPIKYHPIPNRTAGKLELDL